MRQNLEIHTMNHVKDQEKSASGKNYKAIK